MPLDRGGQPVDQPAREPVGEDLPVGLEEDRPLRAPGDTVLAGEIVEEIDYGGDVLLLFRSDPPGVELQVSLPGYVYERLHVAEEKRWDVVLRRAYLRTYRV